MAQSARRLASGALPLLMVLSVLAFAPVPLVTASSFCTLEAGLVTNEGGSWDNVDGAYTPGDLDIASSDDSGMELRLTFDDTAACGPHSSIVRRVFVVLDQEIPSHVDDDWQLTLYDGASLSPSFAPLTLEGTFNNVPSDPFDTITFELGALTTWTAGDIDDLQVGIEGRATGAVDGFYRIEYLALNVEFNEAPVAVSSVVSIPEDSAGQAFVLTCADQGEPQGFTQITSPDPAIGTLTGTIPAFTFTPVANGFGTTNMAFQCFDGEYVSENGIITFNVLEINDAPSFTKGPDQTVADTVSGGVSVPNWATNLARGGGTPEASQTLSFIVTPVNAGLFAVQPAISSTGTLTYTPALNHPGTTSVSVKIQDSGGVANGGVDQSAAQTFSITVTSANDAPVLGAIGPLTTNEDTVAPFTALANDPDVGSALVYSVSVAAGHGTAAVNSATGAGTYTPAANYTGSDTFTIMASDGLGGTDTEVVSVTVNAVADAPGALNFGQTVTEDTTTPVSFAASVNDAESADSALTIQIVSTSSGALTSTIDPMAWSYVPAANFTGTVTITYRATDPGALQSAVRTLTITVTGVNDAPSLAALGPLSLNEDATAPFTAVGSDADSGTLQYTILTQPLKGTAIVNITTGAGVYTPAANYNGVDSFVVRVSDGGLSAQRTVNVTIAPVADNPVANAGDNKTVAEATLVKVNGNQSRDPDNLANPTSGLTYNWTLVSPASGITLLNATAAQVSFTSPTLGASQNQLNITLRLIVKAGARTSAADTVLVQVVKKPVASPLSVTTQEDKAVHFNVTATTGLGALTYAISSSPKSGAVSLVAGSHFKYTPNGNFNGVDKFNFTATASSRTSDPALVTITVTPVNDAPSVSAGNDQVVLSGAKVSLAGTATDIDSNITLLWGQVGGTAVGITNNTKALASFTAPTLAVGANQTLVLRLTATETSGSTQLAVNDTVSIRVHNQDKDFDAVADDDDNCANEANHGQGDEDQDGLGDACDEDSSPLPSAAQLTAQIKDIVVKVTRKDGANVITWELPAGIEPLGVQIFRSNSPFVLVTTIEKDDQAFEDGSFTDTSPDAKASSKYLVTPFYSRTADGGFYTTSTAGSLTTSFTGVGLADDAEDAMRYIAVTGVFLATLLGAFALVLVLRGNDTTRKAISGVLLGLQVVTLGLLLNLLNIAGDSVSTALSEGGWATAVFLLHIALLGGQAVLIGLPSKAAAALAGESGTTDATAAPTEQDGWQNEFGT